MANRPSLPLTIALVLAFALSGCVGNGGLGDADTAATGTGGDDLNAGNSNTTGSDDTTTTPGDDESPSPSDNDTTLTPGNTTDGNGTADGNTTIDNTTTFRWGPQADATVRPGVQVVVGGSICTTNFLYRSPQNGTYYLGIAAHCVYDTLGEEVRLSNAAGVIGSSGERIGTVAYSSYKELGISQAALGDPSNPSGQGHPDFNDLALIQLDEAILPKTHPSMKHFGGPTGNVSAISDVGFGDKLLAHGDTPMRPGPDQLDRLEGYVTGINGPWTVYAYFLPYGFQGDSGSAVITGDGQALGVIVALAATGEMGISFLPPMLEFAAESGFPVELVTWDQLERGLLP